MGSGTWLSRPSTAKRSAACPSPVAMCVSSRGRMSRARQRCARKVCVLDPSMRLHRQHRNSSQNVQHKSQAASTGYWVSADGSEPGLLSPRNASHPDNGVIGDIENDPASVLVRAPRWRMNDHGPLASAFVGLADTLVTDYDPVDLAWQLIDDAILLPPITPRASCSGTPATSCTSTPPAATAPAFQRSCRCTPVRARTSMPAGVASA